VRETLTSNGPSPTGFRPLISYLSLTARMDVRRGNVTFRVGCPQNVAGTRPAAGSFQFPGCLVGREWPFRVPCNGKLPGQPGVCTTALGRQIFARWDRRDFDANFESEEKTGGSCPPFFLRRIIFLWDRGAPHVAPSLAHAKKMVRSSFPPFFGRALFGFSLRKL